MRTVTRVRALYPDAGSTARSALLFLALQALIFFLLYNLRSLDDSRFTSWDDVYSTVRPLRTFFLFLALMPFAIFLSGMRLAEHRTGLVLAGLAVAVSVPFWREPEMIVDASRYFAQAKHLEVYGIGSFFREWGRDINAWTDLPLIPLLYGLVFSIFGEQRVAIQAFNTLLFSAAVLLTYKTGEELWDRETGLRAAVFLLSMPYLLVQAPLMLVDMPAMFFLMLALYIFLLSLRRGGVMTAAAALAIFLAFFTKYSAWLVLTTLPLLFAAELYRNRKQGLDRYGLRGMVVFFAAFFLISLLIAFKHDELMQQIHLLISYQKPGLKRWGESLAAICLFQVHPLITIMALASVVIAARKRDISYIAVAWPVLLLLVLGVRRVRYLVLVFPMLSLMASFGLQWVKNSALARSAAFTTMALSLAVAFSAFLPFLNSTSAANLRDAAAFLDTLNAERVYVFTPQPEDNVMNPSVSVPLLDLLTIKKIVYPYRKEDYPLPEDFDESSLRFTWTYRNPAYYGEAGRGLGRSAVVVIADSFERALPAAASDKLTGLSGKRIFSVSDRVYRHQTLVTVYY